MYIGYYKDFHLTCIMLWQVTYDLTQPSVADWGDGVSASCTVGQIVR